MFPETVGAPNVLDRTIPKGLVPSFLFCFSNDEATAPPDGCPITVSIS